MQSGLPTRITTNQELGCWRDSTKNGNTLARGDAIEIGQEHLALTRDVELAVDAQTMIADGAGRDAEPFGDVAGGVSGEHECHDLVLALGELWPKAAGRGGEALRRRMADAARALWCDPTIGELAVQRMQGLEGWKCALEPGDVAGREGLGRPLEKHAERCPRPIVEQDADLVADDGLREKLGDVAALLELSVGEAAEGNDAGRLSARPMGVEGVEGVVDLQIAPGELVGEIAVSDELRTAAGDVARDRHAVVGHEAAGEIDERSDIAIRPGGGHGCGKARPSGAHPALPPVCLALAHPPSHDACHMADARGLFYSRPLIRRKGRP